MTRLLSFSMFAWLLFLVSMGAGCGGGGLTQQDMLRHAIRRAPDDDPEETIEAPATGIVPPQLAGRDVPGKPSTATEFNATEAHVVAPRGPGHPTSVSVARPAPTNIASTGPGLADPSQAVPVPGADSGEPLTASASRQVAIRQMVRIGEALQAHLQDRRHYPPSAIYGSRKEALLSWRVALLPYLGHADLYAQFKLDEPFNSEHNQFLVDRIPSVFQATGLEPGKTTFLLPVGAGTAFSGHRGVTVSQFEDGVNNTVILLEVDPDRAVVWTAPEDHHVNLREPGLGLGSLRGGGFLVAWGGGTVNWVPQATPTHLLRAIYTPDAGDGILATQVGRDPLADRAIDPHLPLNDHPTTAAFGVAAAARALSAPGSDIVAMPATVPHRRTIAESPVQASSSGMKTGTRQAVPTEEALRESRSLLRGLYQQAYRQAVTPQDKHALVKQMFGHLKQIDADVGGQYALLDTVRQISLQSGAVETALLAVEELSLRFDIDSHTTKLETLVGLTRTAGGQQSPLIVQASLTACEEAFAAEDYDVAEQLCGLALTAARKRRDAAQTSELQHLRQEVQAAKRSQVLAERAMTTLALHPQDAHAATLLGKYLCLVRQDWPNGLAVLAAGDDPLLAPIAQRELERPAQGEDQVTLGDQWWQAADRATLGEQRAMRLRAIHWYRLAVPHLPPGLARVKAERRLQQFDMSAGL